MADLNVPAFTEEMSTLDAALAYADAGLYVGPVQRGTKDPGSYLGKSWQRQTSRDAQVITSWFPGSNFGVFLHAGRSGCVIFDVDNPEKLHPAIRQAIEQFRPPYQSTRPNQPGRGHYLFRQPDGRNLGNAVGKLANGWGEVRGLNGVIIVAPSEHENAADGGFYRWCRTGPVPALPGYLSSQLPDALDAEEAATDAQVTAFLREHDHHLRPDLLDIHVHAFQKKVREGESRHGTMMGHAAGAMKEAAAGLLDGKLAADTLEGVFLGAVSAPPTGKQGRSRTGALARNEWRGVLAWGVAQGRAADPNETLIRIADKVPLTADQDVATTAEPEEEASTANAASRKSSGPSVATQLARMALKQWTFGISTEGEPFAIPRSGPRIVQMLRGGRASFRAELADMYQRQSRRVAGQQALADTLLALEGRAGHTEPVPLALRVAHVDGTAWLDLGDLTGRAVKITADGWTIEEEPQVLFRRTALTGSLPDPAPGGSLDELWRLVNVAPESMPLLIAWLVAALLLPDTPHPILTLTGEQGTAKTSTSKMVGALFDPSPAQLRKPPRDIDGWVTAAAGSWLVGIDNVSAVPDWWSDSLCRAVTGDGDVRRKLYSDAELTVFAFRRCVLMNGIDLGTVRDDLAERLLPVELHRITHRLRDAHITAAWQEAHPRVLGALLDLAAEVLKLLPSMPDDNLPRMADFARVLMSVDEVLGTNGMASYRRVAGDLAADAVTSDPVLSAIAEKITADWIGTAAELRALLGDNAEHGKDWPKDARSLTAVLRRRAPSLRRLGWTVDDLGRTGKANAVKFLIGPPEGKGDSDASDRNAAPLGERQASDADVWRATGEQRHADARQLDHLVTRNNGKTASEASDASDNRLGTPLWQFEGREESTHERVGGATSLASLASLAAPCKGCGGDMDPVLTAAGEDTHPTCVMDGAA